MDSVARVAQDSKFRSPKPTPEEAKKAGLHGWNIVCNRCGNYGAQWIRGMRPGWGSLALCGPAAKELEELQRRHARELAEATTVRFEQPHPNPLG